MIDLNKYIINFNTKTETNAAAKVINKCRAALIESNKSLAIVDDILSSIELKYSFQSTNQVETWRYFLPSLKGWADSWSIVFMDSTGCFSVISDYGNWGHKWPAEHTGYKDFREFIINCDAGYIANKIGGKDNKVLNIEGTTKALQRGILNDRRNKVIDSLSARVLYNRTQCITCEYELYDFHFYCGHEIDINDYLIYSRSFSLDHWVKVSFERLKEKIKADIKDE